MTRIVAAVAAVVLLLPACSNTRRIEERHLGDSTYCVSVEQSSFLGIGGPTSEHKVNCP